MIFEKQVIRMYQGMMYTRCDDDGTAFYFSAEDFPGLIREAYPFRSSAGHTLQGYLYHYEATIPGRMVVFDHGFGGGHRSYMKEIEMLCKHGYLVFAYDHTGCMESGGDTPGGMAQSLCDLNDCMTMLKADPCFSKLDISVMGHSWGGFSSLNIVSLHPEISHVVVLSGFVSVEQLICSYFSGLMKGYRKPILALERQSNPRFVDFHGVESLSNTDAKVLLIYSDNDKLCRPIHYEILKAGLEKKPNVCLRLLQNKGHNPNYTEDAVGYLGAYVAKKNELIRKKQLTTAEQKAEFLAAYDWDRMTAQDESVWKEIFTCLDR